MKLRSVGNGNGFTFVPLRSLLHVARLSPCRVPSLIHHFVPDGPDPGDGKQNDTESDRQCWLKYRRHYQDSG